ncbi:uncharacterized protein LOC125001015 [Mugil cephalus]|uniref:uncharacterized protein LOC125001015 n=1 Tax=Mugil cephalus TaxID=48193 RepID=UPI001FB6D317|nr:uncharacterized protein LOC125001015 [Mugil cephalus]XP_047432875.1 uncharacterized protein LOC125001015 [Mugil cephalus]
MNKRALFFFMCNFHFMFTSFFIFVLFVFVMSIREYFTLFWFYTWWSSVGRRSFAHYVNTSGSGCMNPRSQPQRMEKLWMLLAAVTVVMTPAEANAVFSAKVGETVVFSPGSDVVDSIKTDENKSMAWKHGSDYVVDFFQGRAKVYEPFEGRCTLNPTTFDLTITNLTPEDSGLYRVQFKRDLNATELRVTLDDANNSESGLTPLSNQESSSQGPTSSVHVENETENNSNGLYWLFLLLGPGLGLAAIAGFFIYKHKQRKALPPVDDANNSESGLTPLSNQESSSQGQTSSVHMENETVTCF